MQALQDNALLVRRLRYRVAGHSIVIEAVDSASAEAITGLFAEWYLAPESANAIETPTAVIRIRNHQAPPSIPRGLHRFEIPDNGVCYTRGTVSYIELEGSLIAVGADGRADVEVWTNGLIEKQSPLLTRVVSYALTSALRRCQLFELHSAAVVEPSSGKGVLIVGSSGSGKTTLTVQLSASGWPYLSDDVLLLSQAGSQVKAWPVRRCFAITSETFAANQFLQTRVPLTPFAAATPMKQRFSPQGVFSSEFRDNCIPQTIFFSQVCDSERSEVSSLSPAETMARLIRMNPWSCYDKTTANQHLAVLSLLAKQSHAYALRAGRDLLAARNSASLLANYVNR